MPFCSVQWVELVPDFRVLDSLLNGGHDKYHVIHLFHELERGNCQ